MVFPHLVTISNVAVSIVHFETCARRIRELIAEEHCLLQITSDLKHQTNDICHAAQIFEQEQTERLASLDKESNQLIEKQKTERENLEKNLDQKTE